MCVCQGMLIFPYRQLCVLSQIPNSLVLIYNLFDEQ